MTKLTLTSVVRLRVVCVTDEKLLNSQTSTVSDDALCLSSGAHRTQILSFFIYSSVAYSIHSLFGSILAGLQGSQ